MGRDGEVRPGKIPPERPGPPGGKRAQNRRRRTQALSEAALTLFLERGIDQVTIDDIAREAGTAKGNFYRYFKDKTDLVRAIFAPMAADTSRAMSECAAALREAGDQQALFAAYEALSTRLAMDYLRDPRVILLYLQESRGPAVGSRVPITDLAETLADGAVALTRVACDHGLLRVDDPRVSALSVVGAVERLALSVLRGKLDASPLDIGTILVSLVLDGIRAR